MMETINQVDSRLEDTNEHDSNYEEILRLHNENLELREKLKELNQKLDQVIVEPGLIKRSVSGMRTSVRKFSTKSEKLFKITHKVPLKKKISRPQDSEKIQLLENKVSELEDTNFRLRKIVDKDLSELISHEFKREYEKLQKYLRLIFKSECVIFHTNFEITENLTRIDQLNQVIADNVPKIENGTKKDKSHQSFVNNNHTDLVIYNKKIAEYDKIIKDLTFKENNLKIELEELNKNIKFKRDELNKAETLKKQLDREVKLISESNAKRAISPVIIRNKSSNKEKRVQSPDEVFIRRGPRSHSNKYLKNNPENEVNLRKSEKLVPINDIPKVEEINHQGFEAFLKPAMADLFRGVNLSPLDFGKTHNFTLKSYKQ